MKLYFAGCDAKEHFYRFYSQDKSCFLDLTQEQIEETPLLRGMTYGIVGPEYDYNDFSLVSTAAMFNQQYYAPKHNCVRTDVGLNFICPDVSKAKKLLAVTDKMIFSEEFCQTLNVYQCQNYDLSHGGLDVTILTSIPASMVDNFQPYNLYTAEEVKNTVLAFLRKYGLVGSATILPKDFKPISSRISKVYTISLHIKDVLPKVVIPATTIHMKTNPVTVCGTKYAYTNGLWFKVGSESFSDMMGHHAIETCNIDDIPSPAFPLVRFFTATGCRVGMFNNGAVFMPGTAFSTDGRKGFENKAKVFDFYHHILENDIVNDIRIKGIRQGCTPFPRAVGQDKMVVEIPVNLSATFFSMEQVKDAFAEVLSDKSTSWAEFEEVSSNKNHLLFHIRLKQNAED